MVVCAYYDLEGNIHSLVTVNDPEGKGVMLAPQPGQLVAEVEGLELTPGKANFDTLRENRCKSRGQDAAPALQAS